MVLLSQKFICNWWFTGLAYRMKHQQNGTLSGESSSNKEEKSPPRTAQ